MWNIDNLPLLGSTREDPAIERALELLRRNPGPRGSPLDFSAVAKGLNRFCIPMYNHDFDVDRLACLYPEFDRLAVLPNPLAQSGLDQAESRILELGPSGRRRLEGTDVASGPFVVMPLGGEWVWAGFHSDYGYLFAGLRHIELLMGEPFLKSYSERTYEFRSCVSADPATDRMTTALDAFTLERLSGEVQEVCA